MDKLARLALLFDSYQTLFTEKQCKCWQLFYDEDLSLSEIAEDMNISRQAVHDSIKRTEEALLLYESKLGLLALKTGLDQVLTLLDEAIDSGNIETVKEARNILIKMNDNK